MAQEPEQFRRAPAGRPCAKSGRANSAAASAHVPRLSSDGRAANGQQPAAVDVADRGGRAVGTLHGGQHLDHAGRPLRHLAWNADAGASGQDQKCRESVSRVALVARRLFEVDAVLVHLPAALFAQHLQRHRTPVRRVAKLGKEQAGMQEPIASPVRWVFGEK